MDIDAIEDDQELKQVLWACHTYWKSESFPERDRIICYSWVLRVYESRFHKKFHQAKLRQLSKLGFLKPEVTSRRGQRRYYVLMEPDRVQILLEKWGLY